MKLLDEKKRIGIFAFYDKDGIVDDYIPHLINAIRQHCGYMLCVVNGALNEQGRIKLEAVSDEILMRENAGLDITGYKEGFFHLASQVGRADEVLFFNQTIYGPVCPLEDMFSEMNARDLDFWGLTLHKELKADLSQTMWNKIDYGYMPQHIQSFFFAVRGRMLHGKDFEQYWKKIPEIHTYIEAVSYHEVRFTKYFTDLGYHGEPFVQCGAWDQYVDYALMGIPSVLVAEKHCPFVKRKSFFEPRHAVLSVPQGGAFGELYRLIADSRYYDVRYILQNLTRTVPSYDYITSLSLTACPRPGSSATGKTVLVVWVGEEELLPDAAQVADTLPAGGKVICLLTENVSAQAAEKALPDAEIVPDVQDGFVTMMRDLWQSMDSFEYVCYLSLCPPEVTDDLYNLSLVRTAENALGDIGADLTMLREMPGVGILVPIPDTVNNLMTSMPARETGALTDILRQSPLSDLPEGRRMLQLPGNSFFASRTAIVPLAGLAWDRLDKLKPELRELLLPLSAQATEQLVGFSLPWKDAVRELWNTREQATRIGSIFEARQRKSTDSLTFCMQGIKDFFYERRYQMTLEQAFQGKLHFKQKAWIILRLLLSEKAFNGLRKLLHGGRLPPTIAYQEKPGDPYVKE